MSKVLVETAGQINDGTLVLDGKTAAELAEVISTLAAELTIRIDKFLKGNNSAGRDARKITLALDRVYKAFRKASV